MIKGSSLGSEAKAEGVMTFYQYTQSSSARRRLPAAVRTAPAHGAGSITRGVDGALGGPARGWRTGVRDAPTVPGRSRPRREGRSVLAPVPPCRGRTGTGTRPASLPARQSHRHDARLDRPRRGRRSSSAGAAPPRGRGRGWGRSPDMASVQRHPAGSGGRAPGTTARTVTVLSSVAPGQHAHRRSGQHARPRMGCLAALPSAGERSAATPPRRRASPHWLSRPIGFYGCGRTFTLRNTSARMGAATNPCRAATL